MAPILDRSGLPLQAPPPAGNTIIPVSTPLHVTQLFQVLLKATFATIGADNEYPFRYLADETKTGIVIDTVFNKESELHSNKPCLIVGRGDIQSLQIVTGDKGGAGQRTGNQLLTHLANSMVVVKVIARHPTEVDLISNEVFNMMVSCRTLLQKQVSLQHIQSINVSQVMPLEQDTKLFYCVCTLAYQIQYKWASLRSQSVFDKITVTEGGVPWFSDEIPTTP